MHMHGDIKHDVCVQASSSQPEANGVPPGPTTTSADATNVEPVISASINAASGGGGFRLTRSSSLDGYVSEGGDRYVHEGGVIQCHTVRGCHTVDHELLHFQPCYHLNPITCILEIMFFLLITFCFLGFLSCTDPPENSQLCGFGIPIHL